MIHHFNDIFLSWNKEERGEAMWPRRAILNALLLALTAGIVIVKAVYELDAGALISGSME